MTGFRNHRRTPKALSLVLTFSFFLLLLPATLHASSNTNYLNINAGYIGLLNNAANALRYGLEYRHKALSRWLIRPALGGFIGEHDATYLYAGIRRDFTIGERWLLAPSLDIGSYRPGNGIDLGTELEFRSGVELGYRFDTWRVSFGLFHLSNGGIGDRNPGTNSAVIAMHIPLNGNGVE